MLIPVQHENMSARRWPVITLGLILLNFGVFLSTHWVMEKQGSQLVAGAGAYFDSCGHASTAPPHARGSGVGR